MTFLRLTKRLLLLVVAAIGAIALFVLMRTPPAPRDLAAPIGPLTGARIAGLRGHPAKCEALLARAGIAYRALPVRAEGAHCGFDDGISWGMEGARAALYAPAAPPLACPLAAALTLWEWDIVQPAAVRAFGTTITGIDHYGSYACRRLYGRARGSWSLHAQAAAIDIAGFRLADGRRISVAADWAGQDAKARFLHQVRDGACRLFGTTLSPDYNAAHHDHLHLDEAQRQGFRACR